MDLQKNARIGWAAALFVAMAACSPDAPLAGKGGSCNEKSRCVPGLVCKDGTCVEDSSLLSVCTVGTKKCDGTNVVKCRDNASGYELDTSCAGSCREGACTVQICDPNSSDQAKRLQCQGDEIMRCRPDGTGFDPIEKCALGCDANTVSCIAGICLPGHRRCAANGTVETCSSNGSAWAAEACDGRCVDNGLSGPAQSANCLKTSCTPGAQRCDGLEIVRCADDGSGEQVVTRCANACSGEGTCVEATCTAGETRCSTDGKSVVRCNATGTGFETVGCGRGVDGEGACLLTVGARGSDAAACILPICTAGESRCVKGTRLSCSADGLAETVVETCEFGCATDGSCSQPACTAGARRCSTDNPDVIETCAPDRRGYVFEAYCQGGCVADVGSSAGARCGSPVCPPLVSRCTTDGKVETCRADGRGYEVAQTCSGTDVCRDGTCQPPPAACILDVRRCNANDVEVCQTTAGYTKIGACLGACQQGTCDAAGECGTIPLKLSGIALDGGLYKVPADGQSTLLVLSEPLVGPSGRAIPEGTLITVAATSDTASPTLLSGDSDPNTPGLQIPVVDGRIDFLLRAPTLANGTAVAKIKAQFGSAAACSGTVEVTFDAAIVDTRYVSEDFSTRRALDPVGRVSNWDTAKGTLTLDAFDAGDGRDGELVVDAGATVDLSTRTSNGHDYADMAIAPIREIRSDLVAVDGVLTPFSTPGTRVLIINLRGSPGRYSKVGVYEQATVAGVRGGYLALTKPVDFTYGEGGNDLTSLADQAVRIVRIPQYTKLTIEGTLTAAAFDDSANGPMGGLLVFMAKGTAANGIGASTIGANGKITMSGKGYRGASKPSDVTCDNRGDTDGVCAGKACASGTVCSKQLGGICVAKASCDSTTQTSAGRAGVGANRLSGESVDGGRDTTTSVGSTYAGGGYMCGSGDIAPKQSGKPYVYADEIDQVYTGVSGSNATNGGASCASGLGLTYGDAGLSRAFLGGGSGSVTRSTAHSCQNNQRFCARRASDGTCCTSGEISAAKAHQGNGLTTTAVPNYNFANINSCTGPYCPVISRPVATAPYFENKQCSSPNNVASCSNCTPPTGPGATPLSGCTVYGGSYCDTTATQTRCDYTCDGAVATPYCDAKVDLFDASYAGAPGGGIIIATIAELDASGANASIEARGLSTGYCDVGSSAQGLSASKCYGGAGGSIYLRTGAIKLGGSSPARVRADGGGTNPAIGGGLGRIRLDYVTATEPTFGPSFTNPPANVVLLDSDSVQSLVVMSLTGTPQPAFQSANALVLPAGTPIPLDPATGLPARGASNEVSQMRLGLAANATSFGIVDVASGDLAFVAAPGTPTQGSSAKWRLAPAPTALRGSTRAFTVTLKVQ